MTFINNHREPAAPFFIPFLVALIFGLPACAVWFILALHAGIVANLVTILLGCCCGFGARIAARGEHPATAAVIATSILILVMLIVVTLMAIALANGISMVAAFRVVWEPWDFNQMANACVRAVGKTFAAYPIGLYVAYRVSDGVS